MKKVIFVGSTSYSGSTFFDMTLGNDPKAFSIGEVNALYEPVKPHHHTPECGCSEDDCSIWDGMRDLPASELYRELFRRMPDVDFIIDSSKDPLWINKRIKDLKRQGIDYRIALIWKSPLDIAHSFDKRGDFDNWERSWVNYHRLLYSLQPENWVTVNYQDYTTRPDSLQELCDKLGIPWFAGKERFWEKSHHLLFGNHSARKHLKRSHRDNHVDGGLQEFQKIVYKPVEDLDLEFRVGLAIHKNPMINTIEKGLKQLSDRHQFSIELEAVAMKRVDIWLRETKQMLKRIRGHFMRPGYGMPTLARVQARTSERLHQN